MGVWWGCISRREGGRGGEVEGGTNEQPMSDKSPLIQCRETFRGF